MKCIAPKILPRPIKVSYWEAGQQMPRPLIVPCGKCLSCLLHKRTEWAFRIKQEWKVSHSAHFVTLTYDRHNLKLADYTLQKRDLQLFFKRLRKRLEPVKVRYYAVGEYGSNNGRPHYHAIIFNANEQSIRNSWVNPKTQRPMGIVHVGQVNESSIMYALKYVIQREESYQKTKPFAIMSRQYGIGLHFLSQQMVDYIRSGNKTTVKIQGQEHPIPNYYLSKVYPDLKTVQNLNAYQRYTPLEWIKQKRKVEAIKAEREKMRQWKKEFPNDWKIKRAQHIQATLDRLQQKTKFTQKF